MTVNNESVYMVKFKEPPFKGSMTDVFLFTSIQAIYEKFTKEQIGCSVKRLWNMGLGKGNTYQSSKCIITKEPFYRMNRKYASTNSDKSDSDNLHDK